MSLISLEHILARLYTNREFRTRFFQEREKVIDHIGISGTDKLSLLELDEEQVVFFAQGLINKRWGVVKSFLPFTISLLKQQAKPLFQQYAENKAIRGRHFKHYLDAIDFCDDLQRKQKNLPGLPDYAEDIIRYEKLLVKTNIISNRILIGSYRYPVHKIDKDFNLENMRRRRTFFLFFRFLKKSPAKAIWW